MKTLKNILLILITLLSGCSTDETNSGDTEKEYEVEITDYKINNFETDKIYPVRNYTNLITDEEIIIYGTYNENFLLEKITQIVYQNNQSHLEMTFDRNNTLSTITNYNLSSNEINDQVFIKEEDSRIYLSRNNETVILQKGEDFNLEPFSNDLIGDKLHQTLNKSKNLLAHLNGSDGLSEKNNSEKTLAVPHVVIGVIVGAIVIKAIHSFGIKKITKETEVESDNVSDLLDKVCNKITNRNFSKSSVINASDYTCNSSEDIENSRKQNHDLMLTLCNDSEICFIDCAGILNGTAYYDSCNECVGGSTGIFDCSPELPVQLSFNSITNTGVFTGEGDKECAGGPWIVYYLTLNYSDKENRILDGLTNLETTRTFDDFGCYAAWHSESSYSYFFENYPVTITDSTIRIPYGISLADDISPSDWVDITVYFRDFTQRYNPKISNEVVFRVERGVNYP